MNESKRDGKKLIITILVVVIAFAAAFIIPSFITISSSISDIMANFLARLIELAIFLLAAVILKQLSVLKPRAKGLATGMVAGALPLLMCLLVIPKLIGNVETYGAIMTITFIDFIVLLLDNFLVGVCEELLFRGLLQNALHQYFGEDSQAKIRLAIFVQSIIFGLVHFVNMFTLGAGFQSVLVQVLNAVGMGMLLGAIYYRARKNIWAPIIIHALVDIRASITSGMLTGTSAAQSVDNYVPSNIAVSQSLIFMMVFGIILITTLVYAAIALYLTRKKVITPYIEQNSSK